jgi:hypothetical protein
MGKLLAAVSSAVDLAVLLGIQTSLKALPLIGNDDRKDCF